MARCKLDDIINSVKLSFLGRAEPVHVPAQFYDVWMVKVKYVIMNLIYFHYISCL